MTSGEDPGAAGTGVAESERILANYFARRPGSRQRVVLASSFFANLHPGDPNGGGTGRSSILAQLHQTLCRLQTDYLDVYWLHNWDRHAPIEETVRLPDELVRTGTIRYIGFSNTPAWVTAQAQSMALLRGWTPLIALQVEYSLLARTVEGELAPLAADQGLALVPWSPLKNGFLSGKYCRGTQVHDSARSAYGRTRRCGVRGHRSALQPGQVQRLDEVSAPSLNYPADLNGAMLASDIRY